MFALKAFVVILVTATGQPAVTLTSTKQFMDRAKCIASARRQAAKVLAQAGPLSTKIEIHVSCKPVGLLI